jgi:hypothetical protein
MIRIFAVVLLACWANFALAEGASTKGAEKSPAPNAAARILSRQAFTEKVAQELATLSPDAKFTIDGELSITRTDVDGSRAEIALFDLYRSYSSAPNRLAGLLRDFAATIGEKCSADCGGKVDRTRITPLIKDRVWIEESRAALKEKQPDLDFVFEDFNKELVIVYVRDAEHRVRFLMSNEDLGVERSALRQLAVENLGRLRPKVAAPNLGNGL